MLVELSLSSAGRRSLACEVLEERLVPATVLATLDTDGNGTADSVLNEGAFIRIVHAPTNTVKNYQLGSGWTLLTTTAVNTDGDANNAADLVFRLGSGVIRIIHDSTGKVHDYDLGPSPTLLTTGATNSDAGTDLVFQGPQGIRIVNDNKKVVRKYDLNGPWQQLSGAPASLDFDPEIELTFTVPGGIRVLNDTTGTSTFYQVPGPWKLLATGDFDGAKNPDPNSTTQSAVDLAFAVPAGLRIIHEANRTMSRYSSSTGFWNLLSLTTGGNTTTTSTDTDGLSGNELIFDAGGGRISIVLDSARKVAKYFVGPTFSLLAVANTHGNPGNELVFKADNTVRIIRNESPRTTKTYLLGLTWSYLGTTTITGQTPLGLRFQVGAVVKTINDQTEKIV